VDLFEIVLILAIALIVIGPDRMPEVIRALVKILRELRAASNSMLRELTDALEIDEAAAGPPPMRPTRRVGPPPAKPDEQSRNQ
jgi:sec-independent protein translocase protein TatB